MIKKFNEFINEGKLNEEFNDKNFKTEDPYNRDQIIKAVKAFNYKNVKMIAIAGTMTAKKWDITIACKHKNKKIELGRCEVIYNPKNPADTKNKMTYDILEQDYYAESSFYGKDFVEFAKKYDGIDLVIEMYKKACDEFNND